MRRSTLTEFLVAKSPSRVPYSAITVSICLAAALSMVRIGVLSLLGPNMALSPMSAWGRGVGVAQRQKMLRVEPFAAPLHFVMQVWAGRAAGGAEQADRIAGRQLLALGDFDARQVRIQRVVAFRVRHFHQVAVAALWAARWTRV